MELKSNFNPLTAMAAHENTILAAPVLPKGMPAPFDHAWGYLDKPGEMERHRHPKEEVYFFFKGEGFVFVDGEEIPVKPGDVVRIPADALHTVINRQNEELLWAALWWTEAKQKESFTMTDPKELHLTLTDTEWSFTHTSHDRTIVRAIVVDDNENFYFVRAERDDDFGRATIIETSGGGVEADEDLDTAIKRELSEELGAEVDILCKLGVVSDYYNLIHRHNINHYYLCRVRSFGEKHLMPDEIEQFHLSTLKLSFEEAVAEYELRTETPLGRLLAQRELPILRYAGEILTDMKTLEKHP